MALLVSRRCRPQSRVAQSPTDDEIGGAPIGHPSLCRRIPMPCRAGRVLGPCWSPGDAVRRTGGTAPPFGELRRAGRGDGRVCGWSGDACGWHSVPQSRRRLPPTTRSARRLPAEPSRSRHHYHADSSPGGMTRCRRLFRMTATSSSSDAGSRSASPASGHARTLSGGSDLRIRSQGRGREESFAAPAGAHCCRRAGTPELRMRAGSAAEARARAP